MGRISLTGPVVKFVLQGQDKVARLILSRDTRIAIVIVVVVVDNIADTRVDISRLCINPANPVECEGSTSNGNFYSRGILTFQLRTYNLARKSVFRMARTLWREKNRANESYITHYVKSSCAIPKLLYGDL